jgi:8-amino-7-oxononanoate synthase
VRRTPEALRDGLAALDAAQLRRRALLPRAGAIDFSSNDYLGLARHPALAKAMAAAAATHGAGSGAAHLVTGHGPEHAALEAELADFVGRESALLFATGYMANLGVVGALVGRGDLVLSDALNHASLIDACTLSRAEVQRFPHLGHGSAAHLLADWRTEHPAGAAAIITDTVFSMDGDLAPLPELAACARQNGAWLLADDAHGLGVLGVHGRGSCEHFNLDSEAVPVLVGTLGKAFGSFGAFVAGERDLIDWILQKARTYIYTTAPPQPVAAATRAALRLADAESWRRDRLVTLIADFRRRCMQAGIALTSSTTPIQPLLLGASSRALRVSDWLLERGLIVKAIRPPTVPAGSARLRIALSARHSDRDIAKLTELLAEALHLFP